jgi:hypothetical protein
MISEEQNDSKVDESLSTCFKRRKFEETVAGGPSTVAQTCRIDHGRIRGRRGHLKLMTEMPFDILHEIFVQLDPIDLLHLSWSTKTLHGILMAKNARFLWTNVWVRLSLRFPPKKLTPPPGLYQAI